MAQFLLRRATFGLITLFLASIVNFGIIQLPPGDFISVLEDQQRQATGSADLASFQAMRQRFGLGEPLYVQYWSWITSFVQGDLGVSFRYNIDVTELIGDRLLLSVILAGASLLFTWALAIPIGVFVAIRKYGVADNVLTLIGFIGLALPNFLLALFLIFISLFWFDATSVGGLFSREFRDASWSLAKIWDLMKHLWIPVIVVGTAGTAALIRIMRTNLIETMGEMFVTTARAKGLNERLVVWKHAVRVAINPLISILGLSLPILIGGEIIVSIVLGLPTLGPLFFEALEGQDMFVAGAILMMLTSLIIIGSFVADLLLAWSDPRIRIS